MRRSIACKTSNRRCVGAMCLLLAIVSGTVPASAASIRREKKTSQQFRLEYLARVGQSWAETSPVGTTGSLWTPEGILNNPATDYKAHTLHDVLTVLVSVQTTAAQSGSVNNARAFGMSSAITGVGGLTPATTNPLLAANSSESLKGQGQTSSNTTFSTSLTGEIIAVFPNGNLVVEGHRQIELNNQHEDVTIRGVARPGDIAPNNVIASSSLSNLEIELKGKGIISDSTRPPNPVTRAILRLLGF